MAQDFTTRMVALLSAMRRERNGAVADAMTLRGAPYGLNYGVSLPTLRDLARRESCDHAFAKYLYEQQVRELRLAAFYLADPEQITAELPFWAAGIVNAEVAAEAAFALLSRMADLSPLLTAWLADTTLCRYAALMAAARATTTGRWSPSEKELTAALAALPAAETTESWAPRLVAEGVVALLSAYGLQSEASAATVRALTATLGSEPAVRYVAEEMAWRL